MSKASTWELSGIINQINNGTIVDATRWETQNTINLKNIATNDINHMFNLLNNKSVASSNIIGKDINNNNVPVTNLKIIIYADCGPIINGVHQMPQLNNQTGIMLGIGSYVLETIIDSNKKPIKKIGAIYIPYGLQVELYQTCNFSKSGNILTRFENDPCINSTQNIDFTISSIKVSIVSPMNKTILDNNIFTAQYEKIFGSINSQSTSLTLYLEASYQDYKNIYNEAYSYVNAEIARGNYSYEQQIASWESANSSLRSQINTKNGEQGAINDWLQRIQNNETYYAYSWSNHSYDADRARWSSDVNCGTNTPAQRGNIREHTYYWNWWRWSWWWAYYPECKTENSTTAAKKSELNRIINEITSMLSTMSSYQSAINTYKTYLKPSAPPFQIYYTTILQYKNVYLYTFIKTLNNTKKIDITTKILEGKLSNIDTIYSEWIK
jgi:hypothetical protein